MTTAIETLTRRRFLDFSWQTPLALSLGGLWRAQPATAQTMAIQSRIRSCILIFFYGGPSHIDTFDMKPIAPVEVRGEFQPISTSVPGLQICEHLPKLSRVMHKVALVRSMHHEARLHDSASIHALTGRALEGPDRELFSPLSQVYPSFGSVVSRFGKHRSELPFAALPFEFHNVVTTPAQGGGMLGAEYDPLQIALDVPLQSYGTDLYRPRVDIDRQRLHDRQQLLNTLGGDRLHDDRLAGFYHRAYSLLTSETLARAVDISQESAATRERYGFGPAPAERGEGGGGGNGAELGYGRQMRGQNLLLARRLVEAGVSFVNVYDFKQQGQNWDAHFKCANQHKTHLLPLADQSLSALITDLDERGLLDSTLVVAMGEFGRTPKINIDGGRDHWPDCYTVLLAGGGVQGGAIYGASDRLGAFPSSDPVTPGDLAATIFWRFGIDPSLAVHDAFGRPHRLAAGEPIKKLFGEG